MDARRAASERGTLGWPEAKPIPAHKMFKHLKEDWPWIVIPAVLILIGSVVIVLVHGPDEIPIFTYTM